MRAICSAIKFSARRYSFRITRTEANFRQYLNHENMSRDSKEILFDPTLFVRDMRSLLLKQAENSLIIEFKGLKTLKFAKKIEDFLADIGEVVHFSPIDTLRNIYIVQFENLQSVSHIVNQGKHGNIDNKMVSINLQKDAPKCDDAKNKRILRKQSDDLERLFDEQENMSQQIDLFTQRCQLSSSDIRVNYLLLQVLEKKFQQLINRNYRLYLFGSSFTGAGMKGADIDIVLLTQMYEELAHKKVSKFQFQETEDRDDIQEEVTRILEDAEKFIPEFLPEAEDVEVIWGARVPILKFNLPIINRSVDLAVNQMTGRNFATLVNWYFRYNPNVMKLYIVVRKWAESKNLLSHEVGGLSPFMLLCMTLTYLIRIQEIPKLSHIGHRKTEIFIFEKLPADVGKPKNTSTEQLVHDYFKYFSRYPPHGVSFKMHTGKITPTNRSSSLQIVNPFDTMHNIGQNCSKEHIELISKEMAEAAKVMEYRRKKLNDRKWGLNALFEGK